MSALTTKIEQGRRPLLEAWRKAAAPGQDAAFSLPCRPEGRFADPASYHREEGMRDVLDWLVADEDADVPASVCELCRAKAVQKAPPSESLAFLFALKPLIRSQAGAGADEADCRALEARIDKLVLHAFDRYAACRDQIAQLRVEEVLRGEQLLRRRLESIQRNGEEPA